MAIVNMFHVLVCKASLPSPGAASACLLEILELSEQQPLGAARVPPHLDLLSALDSAEGSLASGIAAAAKGGPPGPAAPSVVEKLARAAIASLPPWAKAACCAWVSNIGPECTLLCPFQSRTISDQQPRTTIIFYKLCQIKNVQTTPDLT